MTVECRDRKYLAGLALIGLLALPPGAVGSEDDSASARNQMGQGERLFQERCAVCHDARIPGIPAREQLAALSSDYIVNALTDGLMLEQAYGLNADQIRALANYVSNPPN